MASDGKLRMWTVYDRPKDFPDAIVARLHEVDAGGSVPTSVTIRASVYEDEVHLFDEWRDRLLDRIRLAIQNHDRYPMHVRIARSPEDDIKIVETWL